MGTYRMVAAAAAVALLSLGSARAGSTGSQAVKPDAADTRMSEPCREMMQRCQQMKTAMEAQDAKLEVKLATMKASTGEQKVAAMADIIETLLAERKQMAQGMGEMPQMMAHMMEMQGGGSQMQMPMAGCPMMKSTSGGQPAAGAATKSGDDPHAAHH